MIYYKLDENKNVIPADRNDPDFAAMWEVERRRVAQENVGGYWVSTVFMPIDHRIGSDGPPLVFETMVFPIEHDGKPKMIERYCERCSTYDEATAMHNRIVEAVRAGEIP